MDANKLKQRIEVLEKENQLLKKSLFELSIRTNSSKNATPYQLKELLDNNGMDQITTLFDNKTEEEGRYGMVHTGLILASSRKRGKE